MQETRELFKAACAYPCDMLAALIEMEHRANDTEREDCVETAIAALKETMIHYEDVPSEELALKAELIELNLLKSMVDDVEMANRANANGANREDNPGEKGDEYAM